jgi:DNA-binding winged helix-turn-helix (wHTH) protein
MRVTFGPFTFDAGRRVLARGTAPIHLGPKAFDLLQILLEQRPNVVPKATLMERLWPDTFVGDNNLATLINDLRTAVGDDARDSTVIRTAHGVGYAFVAAAAGETPRAQSLDQDLSDWLIVWDHRTLRLFAGENIVGRPAPGVIGLDAPTVSRQHARILIDGERATVEDLGSKNGTWLGAERVTGTRPVAHGDELRFGLVLVKLLRSPSDLSTRTGQWNDTPDDPNSSRNS